MSLRSELLWPLRYQDYLNSLRWDDVSWSTLYSLLGDLPDEAPLEMFLGDSNLQESRF